MRKGNLQKKTRASINKAEAQRHLESYNVYKGNLETQCGINQIWDLKFNSTQQDRSNDR
jgi:hypothetical protein